MRWLLLTVAFFVATFLLVGKIAIASSNDSYWLATTGLWVATVPLIFILTMAIAAFLAMRTMRAPAKAKPRWKSFWNVVEIVWLMGTGAGVFAIMGTSAIALAPVLQAYNEQQLRE